MTRDPWLDNAKMTLVTLVVIGHSWGLLGATELDLRLYDFLYLWHIPAFVVLTGHLSRTFAWDRRHLTSLLTTIVVPYLVFEWVLFTWRAHLGQHEQGPLWLQPHWGMWYLCVLFFWRLATPLLKYRVALPLSVVVGLAGGLVDELWFGLPRILGLLPFFVLGLHLDRRVFDRLDSWWARAAGVGVLLVLWQVAGTIDDWGRSAFSYYDAPYSALGFPAIEAAEIRLRTMAAGLAGTFAVLTLVPRGRTWFSRMGAATLVVYLCHGFVVRYAEYRAWFDWAPAHDHLALLVVTSSAIMLSLLLAWPPVARALYRVVDPLSLGGARRLARQRQDDVGDRGGDRPLAAPAARERR
jgi:fucose 4-O-acetylase-like acetyltransferase